MKNSNITWIGMIPDDWEIYRLGSIFSCRNEKVNDQEYLPLSVSKNGVVPQLETVAKSDANDNRKKVLKNDFVINSRSDRKQSCGLSNLEGSVSLINTVLYVADNDKLLVEYTNILLKNYGFAEEFYRWGHGIVADLWTTRWQEMKSIFFPLPSIDKQKDILIKLSRINSNIEKLIANEQAQIEKMKEYRQSVITETVTKGLDPTVPMKDSGVDWLGNIPHNWTMRRVKYVCILNPTITKKINDFDTVGYVPMECVKNGFMESKEISVGEISTGLCAFENGDVVMAKVTPCFENGNIAIANNLTNGIAVGSSELFVFRPTNIQTKYLLYYLQNDIFKKYAISTMTGTGGLKRVSSNFVKALPITYPQFTEQQKIADYLDKKCADIDRLIEIKKQKIEKLNDYKKSLIYEYVTGKKEV